MVAFSNATIGVNSTEQIQASAEAAASFMMLLVRFPKKADGSETIRQARSLV